MTRKTFARNICAAGGVLVAAALLPAVSFAQSAYPTGGSMKASRGHGVSHGYFDVNPGKSHSIADVSESETYRICVEGKGGKLIIDGKKEIPLDHGDCHDASGKTFEFKADEGGKDETEGYYRHLRRDRR